MSYCLCIVVDLVFAQLDGSFLTLVLLLRGAGTLSTTGALVTFKHFCVLENDSNNQRYLDSKIKEIKRF